MALYASNISNIRELRLDGTILPGQHIWFMEMAGNVCYRSFSLQVVSSHICHQHLERMKEP